VRGGVKFYRGSARAARDYVEAERGRADDYYLAEGTGFAERYSATADGQVQTMPQMNGDAYEAWVSGIDPQTGELRGRVRTDEHALRFAEVVVNGPKSWSIAAELHPDIAAAYEAAQDRAATEIVAWMARNATTRVGPRGAQVATPVERLEAVSVRHYTSRAGDPHRHLHLQINARVQAAGKWRGID
jgi:exodeoxyribonuclease V alpha subunit